MLSIYDTTARFLILLDFLLLLISITMTLFWTGKCIGGLEAKWTIRYKQRKKTIYIGTTILTKAAEVPVCVPGGILSSCKATVKRSLVKKV